MAKRILAIASSLAILLCGFCVFTLVNVYAEDAPSAEDVKAAIQTEMRFNKPAAVDFLTNDAGWHGDGEATTANGHWATDITGGVHIYNKGASSACLGFDWKGAQVKLDGFHMVIGPVTWIEDNQRFFGMNIGAALSCTGGQPWGDKNMMFRINTKSGNFEIYTDNAMPFMAFSGAQIVKDMETYTTMFAFDINEAGDLIVTLSNSNGDYAVGATLSADKFPSTWTDHTKAYVALTGSNTSEAFKFDIYSIRGGEDSESPAAKIAALEAFNKTVADDAEVYPAVAANFEGNDAGWYGKGESTDQQGMNVRNVNGVARVFDHTVGSAFLAAETINSYKLDGAHLILGNYQGNEGHTKDLTIGLTNKKGTRGGESLIMFYPAEKRACLNNGKANVALASNSDVIAAIPTETTMFAFALIEGGFSVTLTNAVGILVIPVTCEQGGNFTDLTQAHFSIGHAFTDTNCFSVDVLAIHGGDVPCGTQVKAEQAAIIEAFKKSAKDDADVYAPALADFVPSNAGWIGKAAPETGLGSAKNEDGSIHLYANNHPTERFYYATSATYAADATTGTIAEVIIDNVTTGDCDRFTLYLNGETGNWLSFCGDGRVLEMTTRLYGGDQAGTVDNPQAVIDMLDGKMTRLTIKKNGEQGIVELLTEDGKKATATFPTIFKNDTAESWTVGFGQWSGSGDDKYAALDVYALRAGNVPCGTQVKAERAAAFEKTTKDDAEIYAPELADFVPNDAGWIGKSAPDTGLGSYMNADGSLHLYASCHPTARFFHYSTASYPIDATTGHIVTVVIGNATCGGDGITFYLGGEAGQWLTFKPDGSVLAMSTTAGWGDNNNGTVDNARVIMDIFDGVKTRIEFYKSGNDIIAKLANAKGRSATATFANVGTNDSTTSRTICFGGNWKTNGPTAYGEIDVYAVYGHKSGTQVKAERAAIIEAFNKTVADDAEIYPPVASEWNSSVGGAPAGDFWNIFDGAGPKMDGFAGCGYGGKLNEDGSLHIYVGQKTNMSANVTAYWNKAIPMDKAADVVVGNLSISDSSCFSLELKDTTAESNGRVWVDIYADGTAKEMHFGDPVDTVTVTGSAKVAADLFAGKKVRIIADKNGFTLYSETGESCTYTPAHATDEGAGFAAESTGFTFGFGYWSWPYSVDIDVFSAHTTETPCGTQVKINEAAAADAIEGLIDAIGTVTRDSETAIVAAETAYNEANARVKAQVENYETLTAARSAFDALDVPVTGVSLDKETATVSTGSTTTLVATVSPDNATDKSLIWTSGDDTIATVENGVVTGVKKGTVTITVKTVDGDFTDTCEVTVNCSHTNTTTHQAVASDCRTQGHAEYVTCDDCNEIISGSDELLPLGDHNYVETVAPEYLVSEANCHAKAVYHKSCSVCHAAAEATFETGDFDADNHDGETYLVGQKEATCYEEGYTGDTYCSGCDAKLSDGRAIEMGAHSPASTWSTDETYHWHVCEVIGCGNIIDKAEHSGGTATCKDKPICEVCGAEYGEKNAANHVGGTEVRDAKSATCSEAGYTGDTYCLGCGEKIETGTSIPATGAHVDADDKWESDATNHWHTCGCGATFETAAHSGGTATCKDKPICEICKAEYGEKNAANHVGGTEVRNAKSATCGEDGYTGDTYCLGCGEKLAAGQVIKATGDHVDADGEWETDGTNHWHTCGCGATFETAAHSGGTATCKDKPICEICKAEYGDKDADNHVGGTEVRDAKSATCSEAGYTGDTYCLGCGEKLATGTSIPATGAHVDADDKWESDATNHWHTCGCGATFETAAHSGGTATCKDKPICEICKAEYGDKDADNHVGGTEIRGQKEATCYEEGYTGDTYCLGCGEKIATGKPIEMGAHSPASTWSTDETYHWHVCEVIGCGNLIDKAAHSGGTATCKDKPVCEVCGAAYGDKDAANHVGGTEIRDDKNATCGEDGYTGDTYCLGCGEKIATGTPIPATGDHVDADDKWESDATNHWHTCGCGATFETAAHSGGTATCKDKPICEVCGAEYGDKDAANHVGKTEVRDAKEATCCEDGYTGDTYCLDCGEKIATGTSITATGAHVDADGKWETDGTNHWHTCSYGTKFDVTSHSGGTATCKDKSICEVCGAEYGDKDAANHVGGTEIRGQKEATCYEEGYTGDTYCLGCGEKIATGKPIEMGAHSPASTWSTDETYHWHACETVGCGNLIDKAAHSGGTATCKDKPICEVCGVAYGEKDASNHVGGTEVRGQKAAVCGEDGYTGDTCCLGCGEVLTKGEVIPKLSHIVTDWTVTKEATTEECGEKTGKCTLCGADIKTEIAKLTAKPISEENTEFTGMETAPKLAPVGETALPENVVFVAEQATVETLNNEQKADVEAAVKALEENPAELLGKGMIAEKADVLCVFSFDLLVRGVDENGCAIGDEEYHFDGTVNVTVEKPAIMDEAENPIIVHVRDDGTSEIVKFIDNGDGTISLEVNGFSNFIVMDVEVTEDPSAPTTGEDTAVLWLMILVAAAAVMTGAFLGKKKVTR